MDHVLAGDAHIEVPILVIIEASRKAPDHTQLLTVEETGAWCALRAEGRPRQIAGHEIIIGGGLGSARSARVSCCDVARNFDDARSLHEQEIVRALGII